MAKVLLICAWVTKVDDLPDMEITRVDFEPALNAALVRDHFDVVVHVATTPGLTLATTESVVRAHAPKLPVIEVARVDEIATRLRGFLASQRS